MQTTDQKPGKGTYACIVCDHKVLIKDESESLPVCPACGNFSYEKKD